jgi:hypothetical protein
MKKVLIGLIVLAALLSVPMAASAVGEDQTQGVTVAATFPETWTLGFTASSAGWVLDQNNPGDPDNLYDVGEVTLQSTAAPWALKIDTSTVGSDTFGHLASTTPAFTLTNPVWVQIDGADDLGTEAGWTRITSAGSSLATGSSRDTEYSGTLQAYQTIVRDTDKPSESGYSLATTLTAYQTWTP